jgi:predicted nucleotidyltransferase
MSTESVMRKTPEEIDAVLGELRAALERLYGERLRGLYLFGSYARGDARAGSDVDVLVVLEHADRVATVVGRGNVHLVLLEHRGQREDVAHVLVVLDEVDSYSGEIQRTSEPRAEVALRHDVSISLVYVSEEAWIRGEMPILQNARREGRAA